MKSCRRRLCMQTCHRGRTPVLVYILILPSFCMLPARLSATLCCRLPLSRRPSLARCRSHRRAYSALRQPRVLASAQQERVLFISLVWPERSSSAAGVRTSDLISGCRQWGWEVAYLSPAAHNEHTAQLEGSGVRTLSCQMNRLVHALGKRMPTACSLPSPKDANPPRPVAFR